MKIDNIASNMTKATFHSGLEILFSYSTPVAAKYRGTSFKTSKKWSATTTKHINKWLEFPAGATPLPQSSFDSLMDMPSDFQTLQIALLQTGEAVFLSEMARGA